MTGRERAYSAHGAALVEHALVQLAARRDPTVDNLTALHLAAFNLEQAEQDLIDWRADNDG